VDIKPAKSSANAVRTNVAIDASLVITDHNLRGLHFKGMITNLANLLFSNCVATLDLKLHKFLLVLSLMINVFIRGGLAIVKQEC
jgi:hypothetical protein